MSGRLIPERLSKVYGSPVWLVVAAFGTYFCMYGFRKPYTAATFNNQNHLFLNYKVLLILSQTVGYVIAKWFGIKFVSEIKPQNRIRAILALICFAELMLLLFAITPRPWNAVCLFLNGLPLGVIFGLVLGFLEGRKISEFLIAGLCASFIVSDGVSKSVGTMLLGYHVAEGWMPFIAGLVFLVPLLVFIAMLSCVPAPSISDVQQRSAREPMTGDERLTFFKNYFPGLVGIILVYLFVTLLRSVRADFAVEIWTALGYRQTPDLFTQSELCVSFGAVVIISLVVLIKSHHRAFRFSLFAGLFGFLLILLSVEFLNHGLGSFAFMVLIGIGVYLPYVAVHAVVFERLIAITRERANVGFLMYIVDAVGYTGYICLMFFKYLSSSSDGILPLFIQICLYMSVVGLILLLFCLLYFKIKFRNVRKIPSVSAR